MKKEYTTPVHEDWSAVFKLLYQCLQPIAQKDCLIPLFSFRQISVIRTSWESITEATSAVPFARLFSERLIWLAPTLRQLFHKDMRSHEESLFSVLGTLVEQMEEPVAFFNSCAALEVHHPFYKLSSFFHNSLLVRDALIFALVETLGPDCTSEVRSAWSVFYNAVERILARHVAQGADRDVKSNILGTAQARVKSAYWNDQVTDLNLCSYKIGTFPNPSGLTHLCKLLLRGNQLVTLPAEIKCLQSLRVLDLARNRLKSVPDTLATLESLVELYLNENSLRELPARLGSLTNLHTLNVSQNKLQDLPTSMFYLRNLVFLDASNNRLSRTPWFLLFCTNLETIRLSMGADDHLKQTNNLLVEELMQEGTTPTCTKMIMLGDSLVGKTVSTHIDLVLTSRAASHRGWGRRLFVV